MKKAEGIAASIQDLNDTMQGLLGSKKLTEEHPSISIEICDFRSTKTSLLSSEPECDKESSFF